MSSASTILLPFQPTSMSTAQLAAVSFLARYSGRTHEMYTSQLARWFAWCEGNGLDPLVGIKRAHVELYIRHLGDSRLMDSSIVTMMHGVRGYFRFAHIDGLITADPAVYARLPKVQQDESRTQGLDRLELIRFLQVAQTLNVHHGALAFLLGINALRASEAAGVRVEDYADTMRGYRVLHLVGKGNKPATMPVTVPVLRVLEACRRQRTSGPLIRRPLSGNPIDRRDVYRMVARIASTCCRSRCCGGSGRWRGLAWCPVGWACGGHASAAPASPWRALPGPGGRVPGHADDRTVRDRHSRTELSALSVTRRA